jgi:Disulphide bond corrector protein DsbC
MKRLKILLIMLVVCGCSYAQIIEPRHWSWKAVQVNGNIYDLVFTMKIDTPWHGYSQYIAGDMGPFPTTISIESNPDVELIGKTIESGPDVKIVFDAMFDQSVKYFNKEAVFTQRVKLKRATTVSGYVEAQACNSNTCLPPETKDFSIKAGSAKKVRLVIEK